MALAHQSIATIDSPEFLNLSPLDINPLMSSCEIKVFYLGENRNGSFISKDVAEEMAKTLRGAPIVGYYKEDKEDFVDHGHQMIWDDTGIHFNCLTKPYGFVSPDAKVWFKDFQDQDEFGNSIVRTYLMTTGFLWTGQFQEADKIFKDNGKSQSMELDEKTVQGHWAKNLQKDMEFFIINDAIFSKLCILGDDVEPCFEGAGVTPTQVSASFTLNNDFKHTLFEMMQQLTEVLQGGNTVANVNENTPSQVEKPVITDFSEKDKNEQELFTENQNTQNSSTTTTFEKKDDDKEVKKEETGQSKEEEKSTGEDDQKDQDKDKYSLLETQYDQLKVQYAALEEECKQLREFKFNIETKQKDELINQFNMLSEEDKKDVIENKNSYSLEEIKSKLAVMCFDKKVNFNLDMEDSDISNEQEKEVITTFNVNTHNDLSIPEWVKEVENTMNNI